MVESSSDEILAGADVDDVAFLVVGDPFGYLFWPSTLNWQNESISRMSGPLRIQISYSELESLAFQFKIFTMHPSCPP